MVTATIISSFCFRRPDRTSILRTLVPLLLVLTICFWVEQVAAQQEENSTITGEEVDLDVNVNNNTVHVLNTTVPSSTASSGRIVDKFYKTAAADAVLFPWFVQLLGCCTMFILTRFNVPIPYAAVMFVFGAIMGYLATRDSALEDIDNDNDDDERKYLQDSIIEWTNIDSATLLLVFLPGLIFKDAVEIPINLFLVASVQIWILSFPMVLVGTVLTGVAGYYCLPYQSEDPSSFGWPAWMILGAILASTDPIAVASVLKTAGASPRLVMHISGESLMNDGSSYVFFQIASQIWYDMVGLTVQHDITGWEKAIRYFFRMSLGGSAVGALFGFGLLGILWELDRRMERDFDIVQVVFGLTTAYLCYFVCDQILIMSGVIGTVACGVVVNRFGRGMIHDKKRMSSYLALADFLLNTLLFALGGVIWAAISFSSQKSASIELVDWGYLMVFYLLCMVIRFVQVGTFYPVLSRIGLKSNWKEGVFLAYGGLHGSVGVALGLSLIQYVFQETTNLDIRNAATKLQFLGGGATLLTLTINGTSAGFILKMLGLVKPPVSAEHTKHVFEGNAKDFVYDQITKLFQELRFQNVSFDVLKEHVPFVTKQPPRLSRSDAGGRHHEEAVKEFNQRVAGKGQQYISLLNATKRASEQQSALAATHTTISEEFKMELLVEMRQIFLELLREAYKVELELGELDQKQHNGFLFDVLIQSVDLAVNEVRYDNKPIEDWQHTEIFFRWDRKKKERSSASLRMSSSEIEAGPPLASTLPSSRIQRGTTIRHSVVGRNASFTSSLLSIISFDNNSENRSVERTQVSMKRIRLDVLRAITFKHGHKMAETKLQLYVNRFDDEEDESMRARHRVTQSALETILSESRDQVCFADEMLEDEVSDKDLEIILSHYCAKILVRKLINFTERKSKEGLIGKQEARTYMRSMKDKIGQIESSTVEELTESRLSEDTKYHHHRHTTTTRSDFQNIPEDGNATIDDNSNRNNNSNSNSNSKTPYSSPIITNSNTDSQVDPQNTAIDTMCANNVKSKDPTISLTKKITSMPEIEEGDDDENIRRRRKTAILKCRMNV